jgi:hypothetical protein
MAKAERVNPSSTVPNWGSGKNSGPDREDLGSIPGKDYFRNWLASFSQRPEKEML